MNEPESPEVEEDFVFPDDFDWGAADLEFEE
jgi:hypothetical protein